MARARGRELGKKRRRREMEESKKERMKWKNRDAERVVEGLRGMQERECRALEKELEKKRATRN